MTMPAARAPRSLTVLLALLVFVLSGSAALAQDAEPRLAGGQRVYDQTGSSLTEQQRADLTQRLTALRASTGADGIVVVRVLEADPEQTLEQVEALQQRWVQTSGADEDTAFAMLINRDADDPGDARAGIFVGSTYDDGNVPRGEQEDIVADALIPPLRDGDVEASLTAGIDRLGRSIAGGPPRSAFETWAGGVARVALPVAAGALALLAASVAVALYRRRPRARRSPVAPTTRRPAHLPVALGAALASGGPRSETTQGVVLSLAGRGALALEPDPAGDHTQPKLQVRLHDHRLVHDPVEQVVWTQLERRADAGVVDFKALQAMSGAAGAVHQATSRQLLQRRWSAPGAMRTRWTLWGVGFVALLLAMAALVVAAVGAGPWWAFVATALLLAAGVAACAAGQTFPLLSRQGQDVAVEWVAYREGLERAAHDPGAVLDLDAALPDAVAMGLSARFEDRLQDAGQRGVLPRCFRAVDPVAYASFPWLVAYGGAFRSPMSSGGGGMVSGGGGAGGGGGAAGST